VSLGRSGRAHLTYAQTIKHLRSGGIERGERTRPKATMVRPRLRQVARAGRRGSAPGPLRTYQDDLPECLARTNLARNRASHSPVPPADGGKVQGCLADQIRWHFLEQDDLLTSDGEVAASVHRKTRRAREPGPLPDADMHVPASDVARLFDSTHDRTGTSRLREHRNNGRGDDAVSRCPAGPGLFPDAKQSEAHAAPPDTEPA